MCTSTVLRNRSESALPRAADFPRFQLDNPITGMLNVVLGHRAARLPEDQSGVPDDEITRVEG